MRLEIVIWPTHIFTYKYKNNLKNWLGSMDKKNPSNILTKNDKTSILVYYTKALL